MEKKRSAYFDNLKGILIFLVVLGHVLSSFAGDGGVARWLYLLIFSFHMPVFIFVSGYFAKPDPKTVIARLLILYLIFQVLNELAVFVVDYIRDPGQAVFDFQLFFPMWTLWYLLALIIYNILLPVFDTGDHRKQIRNLLIAFAMGILISFSVDTENFLAANRIVTFLPFYLAGYYGKINGNLKGYLRKRKKVGSRYRLGWKLLALAFFAAMLVNFWFTRNMWSKAWFYGTDSYRGTSLTPWIKLLTYGVAVVWIFIFLVLLPKRPLGYLTKIGRNTLGVYLFHGLILRIIREIPVVSRCVGAGLWWSILLAVVITVVFSADRVDVFLKTFQYPRRS